MLKKTIVVFILLLAIVSCDYFRETEKPQAVARVNDAYLYESDLSGLVPEGTSREDSIIIIKNYIDRWASQKLIYDAAEINLSREKQEEYDNLIRQYKLDLYSKAYLEQIVKTSVDTVVLNDEAIKYYNENKENFRTAGSLIRLKYINVANDHPKLENLKRLFLSNRKEDMKALNNLSIQFKAAGLNDTTWVDINQVYQRLPFITPENIDKYVSPGMSYQYLDSTNVYMVKIREVLDKNQISPYEYIKPTLVQLIINNRKLELIKKFQKEITDDAIKNNKYEVYK